MKKSIVFFLILCFTNSICFGQSPSQGDSLVSGIESPNLPIKEKSKGRVGDNTLFRAVFYGVTGTLIGFFAGATLARLLSGKDDKNMLSAGAVFLSTTIGGITGVVYGLESGLEINTKKDSLNRVSKLTNPVEMKEEPILHRSPLFIIFSGYSQIRDRKKDSGSSGLISNPLRLDAIGLEYSDVEFESVNWIHSNFSGKEEKLVPMGIYTFKPLDYEWSKLNYGINPGYGIQKQ